MNKPLITVIVPVYKVEQYLDECIQSLITQTYRHIEIILVDDGSPDKCGDICDNYAKHDSRIRVIHKKNGGLSSARNTGLDVAKGDYIAFLDSDDYINNRMYEKLLTILTNQANVAMVSTSIIKFRDFTKEIEYLSFGCSTLASKDWMRYIIDNTISITVWNKLFRSDLISDIRFKEGRNNEDRLFMFELSKKLMYSDWNMVNISEYLYYYRIRENSICNNKFIPLDIDIILNDKEILEYVKSKCTSLLPNAIRRYILNLFYFNEKIIKESDPFCGMEFQYYNELKSIPNDEIKLVRSLSHKLYAKILLLKYLPKIYRKIF